MEAVERSPVEPSPTAGDAEQRSQDDISPDGANTAAADKGPDPAQASDAA